jgi:hypothetical protein
MKQAWRRAAGALLGLALMAAIASAATGASAMEHGDGARAQRAHPFDTVGIYIQPPAENDRQSYDFFKACGYNYLEFVEGGFGRRPDALSAYYAEMSRAIDAAHKKGFRVSILLLAGMVQWKGPAESGSAGTFSALDRTKLQERLDYLQRAVTGLSSADGFAFFAGDPGGDPEGRSTVEDCIAFSRQVHRIVREHAPKAGFSVNLWAIAEWAGFPSPFSLTFWQQQVKLSRAVAESPSLLGPDCGIVFSLDNYYRSLTLTCYADAGITPELYPAAQDIRKLRDRGVKPILGWPYFLVDEVDDGFITPNNVASGGQSQAETRYIRAIATRGRTLGLDGLVANASFVRAEPLNIWAFAQMCRSPELTPGRALDRYAGFLADAKTKGELSKVLRFIENNSNWQNSLPPASRLPDFDCGGVTSATIALERLAKVRPCARPAIPLPEPPALYLARLRKRLEAIAAGRIGGVAPIVRSKPKVGAGRQRTHDAAAH